MGIRATLCDGPVWARAPERETYVKRRTQLRPLGAASIVCCAHALLSRAVPRTRRAALTDSRAGPWDALFRGPAVTLMSD